MANKISPSGRREGGYVHMLVIIVHLLHMSAFVTSGAGSTSTKGYNFYFVSFDLTFTAAIQHSIKSAHEYFYVDPCSVE